jgi:hypothetical protein
MPQPEGGPRGQSKLHKITRTDPVSGVVEEREVTQQEWREQGQTLKSEGWTRPEGEADEPDVPSAS